MGRSFRFAAFRCAAALPLCWVACVVSNGVALAQIWEDNNFPGRLLWRWRSLSRRGGHWISGKP